ncbi:MAG: type transport system ATP-binding protein [Candidatus Eremiobacteraeota bacterium]|nr:type transport system ATP-binding protein [Candidatus Eremiobacteraeota bacterium]
MPPTVAPYAAPPAGAVNANAPLPMPAAGTSRAGGAYDVYLQAPPDGNTASFTVFEPATVTAGQTYPLILAAQGWAGKRTTASAQSTLRAGPSLLANVLNGGYGVAFLDQHGFAGPGMNSGVVDVQDPNHTAPWQLAMLNWMEVNVPWLAFGPSVDGTLARTPIMGASGFSYGGSVQYMLLQNDDRKRLHALVPEGAPTEFNKALAPNGVKKAYWNNVLAGSVTAAGVTEDPVLFAFMSSDDDNPELPAVIQQILAYHSFEEQCNGVPGITDGDLGPVHALGRVPAAHILMMQGIRDHLHPVWSDYGGFACAAALGGDVRYWTYQYGHNAGTPNFPDDDPPYTPPTNHFDMRCGTLEHDAAVLAWFNEKLKGQPNAAAFIPHICISLTAGDGVSLAALTTGRAGTAFSVPSTTVTVGNGTPNWKAYLASNGTASIPSIVPLYTVPAGGGNVLAGISHVELAAGSALSRPTMFVGIGHRAAGLAQWDLVDGQVQPIQGTGALSFDTAGEGARLAPGDQVALLIFGDDERFDSPASPLTLPARQHGTVTVSGTVWVPILPSQASI